MIEFISDMRSRMLIYLFANFTTLLKARCPIVSSTAAVLRYVEVLRVEKVFVL